MPKKEEENRCWPGYEPVPGKPEHSQGSCRPKADSKLAPSEKTFRVKRARQLSDWKASHKNSPKKAAQHLHKPGTTTKTATATKKTAAAKKAPKRAASKKTAAR